MRQLIICIIAFTVIHFSCDKKDNDTENNQNICYHKVFTHNIAIEEHSNYSIDIDGDDLKDINFYFSNSKLNVKSIVDYLKITKGFVPFSGSYHQIKTNDTINETLSWYKNLYLADYIDNVFYGGILDFIGVRKEGDGKNYYGWLAVEKNDSSFKLKEIYFLKSYTIPVLAGIINDTCIVE